MASGMGRRDLKKEAFWRRTIDRHAGSGLSVRAWCCKQGLTDAAVQYAFNQWDALCVYTTDGRLSIDNNASENALRRVAIGRKNWLFCGSDKCGRTAATIFSLIATCQSRRVGIEPLAYLCDVLSRIAATPISQLGQFLPDRWQPLDHTDPS